MKTLKEYKALPTNSEIGVTWGTAFNPPIHGTVNGLPVRILNIGDLPGASDVLLCTDETGFLQPVKRTDLLVTDGAYLPLKGEMPTTASTR